MSIKNLRYWVFTSGENGIHGLDWGIKHASEYFLDRQQLDTDYRALLKDFGLPPSLERPAEEVGLILLRWKREDFIAGFIFAGTDHGDRPNTSSVVCLIPSELIGRKSVNKLIRDICTKNNIAEIARKNSQDRPDTLRLEGDSVFIENIPCFKNSVSWPSYYNGWLQIDGNQRELLSVNAPVSAEENKTTELKKTSGRKFTNIFLVLMVAAVTFGAYRYFITSSGKTESTSDHVPPKVSPDKDNSSAKEDGMQGEINALREKLFLLLKGKTYKVEGQSFTVRLLEWNKDKARLFNECSELIGTFQQSKGIQSEGISRERAKEGGQTIKFSLQGSIPKGATIEKCIEAFLSQITR